MIFNPETELVENKILRMENGLREAGDRKHEILMRTKFTELGNSANHVWGGLEQNPGLGDDTELAEAAEDGEEELGILILRANRYNPFAGDDLQLRHVRGLRAVPEGLSADSGVRQRAADGQPEVVGERQRGPALLEALVENFFP